jgi:hypothetical protein
METPAHAPALESRPKKIPMSTEELQELFLNTGVHHTLDFRNSALKGEAFLIYVANMQLSCSIAADSEVPTEHKLELLRLFLTFRQTVLCDTLLNSAAILLLRSRGLPVENTVGWLDDREMDLFVSQNRDLVERISHYLDSMLITAASFSTQLRDQVIRPAIQSGAIREIDDADLIGVNVLGLLSIPDFLELFLSAMKPSLDSLCYYKAQAERLTYNKKQAFALVVEREDPSFLMGVVNLLFSNGDAEKKLIFDFLERSEVT